MGKSQKNKKEISKLAAGLLKTGSTWFGQQELKKFNISAEKLKKENHNALVCKTYKTNDGQEDYFSLEWISDEESCVAEDFCRLLVANDWPNYPNGVIDKAIDMFEARKAEETGKNFKLHDQQRAAVRGMVNNSIFVLTGGPGTGKTFTLEAGISVIEMLHKGIDIRLTAPTGKAACRMTESTGRPAKTIQKELGITYTNSISKDYTGDLLIVDEISMLDMDTAYQLSSAMKSGKHLILVGDTDQLPSVGGGAVLRDLLESEVIPSVCLTKTYRQANESALFGNILRVRDGNINLVEDEKEFPIVNIQKDKVEKQCVDLVLKEIEKYGIENVVCLMPYRRNGKLCSNNINNLLQQRLNPRKPGQPFMQTYVDGGRPVIYMANDQVMQLKNREECVNGDVGKVIKASAKKLIVDFNGTQVAYEKEEVREQLSLAYAMSINKSQGSEYKSVVMCISTEHDILLQRNMLYTGITRAKERCVLLCDKDAIGKAMGNEAMWINNYTCGRTTMLAEKLRYYKKKFELEATA